LIRKLLRKSSVDRSNIVSIYVLYVFLKHLIDFDEIWYRDRLDFGEKHRLYLVTKKEKGSINTSDKCPNSFYFVITIKNEETERNLTVPYHSVHLENGERIYFTENNFLDRLFSPKMTLVAFFFFFDCMAIYNIYSLKYITNYYFIRYFGW
jgi:hypothetical protein